MDKLNVNNNDDDEQSWIDLKNWQINPYPTELIKCEFDEHSLKCNCYKDIKTIDVKISSDVLMELVFWARRYCDGRSTYAPTRFNWIYQYLRSQYPDLLRCKDQFDPTLKDKGAYWPYAQDGMYDEKTGSFDARK